MLKLRKLSQLLCKVLILFSLLGTFAFIRRTCPHYQSSFSQSFVKTLVQHNLWQCSGLTRWVFENTAMRQKAVILTNRVLITWNWLASLLQADLWKLLFKLVNQEMFFLLLCKRNNYITSQHRKREMEDLMYVQIALFWNIMLCSLV